MSMPLETRLPEIRRGCRPPTENGKLSRMTLRERLMLKRDAILAAATAHGARDLRLFGSVARGAEREDSDVDFLVTLERGRTLLDLARLELQLEAILGRSVDVVTESSLTEPVRSSAMREAIVV